MIFYWQGPGAINDQYYLGLGGVFMWGIYPIAGGQEFVQCFIF